MASAEDYAKWITANADKKGTTEFETVAKAYRAAKGMQASQPQAQQNDPMPWSKVPIAALNNAPDSALKFGKGLLNVVSNPKETITNLADIGGGAIRNMMPDAVTSLNDKLNSALGISNHGGVEAQQKADAFGQYYKDRYGSLDGFKKALAEDPVGVMSDVSSVLSLGGGAVGMTGRAPQVANVIKRAADVTNPLNAPVGAAKVVGAVVPKGVGSVTQTGSDSAKTAFTSGMKSNKAFIENIKGDVPIANTVDKFKKGLDNMRRARADEYNSLKAQMGVGNEVLSLDDIKQAVKDAKGIGSYGEFEISPASSAIKSQIDDILNNYEELYKKDPAQYGNIWGFDALKQSMKDLRDRTSFGTPDRLIVDKVYNAIKKDINKQDPLYSKLMSDYELASKELDEIQKVFSTGERSSKATAANKLQSLTRNNVYSNYGHRQNLAQLVKEKGGVDIMPDVAGQAMSPWLPRTLAGQLETLATAGFGLHDPTNFLLMIPQSPRIMGEALYRAGQVYGPAEGMLRTMSQNPLLPSRNQLNLISQMGRER